MSQVKHVNEEELKAALASGGKVLVDFFADWCGPCKTLAPFLDELNEEFSDQVTILKVDTDKHKDLASEYNVHSLPTLILFEGGKKKDQMIGLNPKQKIKEFLGVS